MDRKELEHLQVCGPLCTYAFVQLEFLKLRGYPFSIAVHNRDISKAFNLKFSEKKMNSARLKLARNV